MRLAPQLGQKPRRSPQAPTFGATERNQVFMVTFGALHAQKTVHQSVAFEVIGKFLLHMQGQRLALCSHHLSERWVIPLDDLIEQSLLWSVRLIGWAVWRSIRNRCLTHNALHSMERSIFS
jgi:hypothetical protein